jgi:hypothetical protein
MGGFNRLENEFQKPDFRKHFNMHKRFLKQAAVIFIVLVCSYIAKAQQPSGTLRGHIRDELGGAIVGATVTITNVNGLELTTTTNSEGVYQFNNLTAGKYKVRATTTGFAIYETAEIEVAINRRKTHDIILKAVLEEEQVTIESEPPVSTEPDNNLTGLVLRGEDLDSLPDDPEELEEALRAMAGPAAGPNGGQIYIDGFTGGRFPPKDSIREIRINSNPFSAEFNQVGFGRIEILTKPGTDQFRGQASFGFGDESLNARNAFASNRPPYQEREFSGNLSGPIIRKKASFFFDFDRDVEDENEIINATVLDPSLNIVPYQLALLTPQRRITFSPRIDYQLNSNNTLVTRYTYSRRDQKNSGIGDFNLPSRAYDSVNTSHSFQLTETAIISQKVVNETRFQYFQQRQEQKGDNSIPTIRVLDAFTGGGAQVGHSINEEQSWELQNYTSWTLGNHSLKAGVRLHAQKIISTSRQNFGGTITFAGGIDTTSIERYKRTILYQAAGLSTSSIRALGGGPTQFTISGGNPTAWVRQWEIGPFIQDDWRISPNFTLSLGLRYEKQNNLNGNDLNFAPRVGFAWAPFTTANRDRGRRPPAFVIRGGLGLFYDNIGENLILQTRRFNGINQQQYLVTDPEILDTILFNQSGEVLRLPSVETLTAFSRPQTIRLMAPDIQTPYTTQASISVEKELPYSFTVFASFNKSRTLHLLRSRNINAPLPGTFGPGQTGIRPFGHAGNVYQYESNGRLDQNEFSLGLNNRFSRYFSIYSRYTFSKSNSDTDGPGSFPANQYDLSGEYGRSSFDIRHRFFVGGSLTAPWGIRLSPQISLMSGRPFNITTGRDTNRDTLFTERPAFATDLNKPGVVVTRFGAFDPNPEPGQQIIPRNYGTGPMFFTTSLRIGKSFGFGTPRARRENSSQDPNSQDRREGRRGMGGGRQGGGGGRGGRGGGGMGRGMGGGGGGRRGGGGGGSFDGDTSSRYRINFSVQIQNVLNRTNFGPPVGNISSPFFGRSNVGAGGFGWGEGGSSRPRQIEAQIRFSF